MKSFITASEIAEAMGVSNSMAYRIIRELNNELKSQGYITICGKVSRKFFRERYYGFEDEATRGEDDRLSKNTGRP